MINVKAPGGKLPALTLTKGNWTDAINEAHKLDPNLPDWQCLDLYSICKRGIITPLSAELFRLYRVLNGTGRIATPRQYDELSAIYVDACDVIEKEMRRLEIIQNGDK